METRQFPSSIWEDGGKKRQLHCARSKYSPALRESETHFFTLNSLKTLNGFNTFFFSVCTYHKLKFVKWVVLLWFTLWADHWRGDQPGVFWGFSAAAVSLAWQDEEPIRRAGGEGDLSLSLRELAFEQSQTSDTCMMRLTSERKKPSTCSNTHTAFWHRISMHDM